MRRDINQKMSGRAAASARSLLRDNQRVEKPAKGAEKGVVTEVEGSEVSGCPGGQTECSKEEVNADWLYCYHHCHSFVTQCSQEP